MAPVVIWSVMLQLGFVFVAATTSLAQNAKNNTEIENLKTMRS
jgi:hypothetical protein